MAEGAEVTALDAVIDKLHKWTLASGSFHADRQLADEVLLADGWRPVPDPTFEGGVRWSIGTNPEVSMGDTNRAHPINDLNAAVGVVPFKARWSLHVTEARAMAKCWMLDGAEFAGISERPSVALLIAALKLKRALAT
jgi:hypothetical protein